MQTHEPAKSTPAPDATDAGLRRAGPADAAAIRELTRLAYARWVPVIGRELMPMRADHDAAVRDHLVDLLHLDGQLAGLIETIPQADHLLVENVAVLPAFQGRGYGRRLLAHAEALAASLGFPELRLYTNKAFAANVRLYLDLGYQVDREEPFMGGTTVYMRKRLSAPSAANPSPAVQVGPLAPADERDLVGLLQEMQAHYRVPCPPGADILADLRNLPSGVTVLVARAPGVVGAAALASVWPGPGLRRGLFLKELFVTAPRRGQGVGAALMRAAARLAVETGAGRIDWTADRDDAPLLAFYRDTGAAALPEKLFFRLRGDALRTLAGDAP